MNDCKCAEHLVAKVEVLMAENKRLTDSLAAEHERRVELERRYNIIKGYYDDMLAERNHMNQILSVLR